MARANRLQDAAVDARLGAAPRRFGFFQAVRLIELRVRRRRRGAKAVPALVGEEADPQRCAIRFRAAPHLSYPQGEIDTLVENQFDIPEMAVNFLGLTGPLGVLPQHYSIVLLRELRRRNGALRDFFDLFNHRLIAFFYRAWAKYRIPISIERGGARGSDGGSESLRALIGFGTGGLAKDSPVPPASLLHYAGFFAHFPRNAVSLEQLLTDYFRLPMRVEPFDGRWLSTPAEQQSRLGRSGRFTALSVDALIGCSYWDIQSNFAILIGPVGYAAFLQLMPEGQMLAALAALTRLYVDPHLGFRVELALARDEIPKLQLLASAAAPARLGWNTWLRHHPAAEDARDAGWYL